MSDANAGPEDRYALKAEKAHERIDDHAEVLDHHDRRITRNENWRLQAQGALKIIAIIVGAGGLAVAVEAITSAV